MINYRQLIIYLIWIIFSSFSTWPMSIWLQREDNALHNILCVCAMCVHKAELKRYLELFQLPRSSKKIREFFYFSWNHSENLIPTKLCSVSEFHHPSSSLALQICVSLSLSFYLHWFSHKCRMWEASCVMRKIKLNDMTSFFYEHTRTHSS